MLPVIPLQPFCMARCGSKHLPTMLCNGMSCPLTFCELNIGFCLSVTYRQHVRRDAGAYRDLLWQVCWQS